MCRACGREVNEHATRCAGCGTALVPTEDLAAVIKMASFHAAKEKGSDFVVWAIDTKKAARDWMPGRPGLICKAMVHYSSNPTDDCQPLRT